uniref:Uncharacterized protein n=1 Tax=Moniliophthora roreri TaxID=221103 RepID=A0A0W0FDT8_MONRR
MTSTIIALLRSSSLIIDGLNTVLRLTAIISSEFIVAVRTWAIWEKNRRILYTLVVFSVTAVIPASIIVARSLITSHVQSLISPALVDLCSVITSEVQNGFIVPYILTIIYEIVTLSLSLFRITTWRKTIPQTVRVPLLDTLWRDGVLYFSFMLVLGFMNIGLILQSEAPQLRQAGAQLQAVLHSIMSTRIVLASDCFSRFFGFMDNTILP